MRKYILSLAVMSLGLGTASHADTVVIPYIKSGGNWVSLVGYVAECPDYPSGATEGCTVTGTNPSNKLHFIYYYKKDWIGFSKIADSNLDATDGSYDDAGCKEYNVEVPATKNDFTTVDVSISNKLGLEKNVLGLAEGYDGGSTAPSNTDFVLEPDAVVDSMLVIEDVSTGIAVDAIGGGNTNYYNTLHAEAVVFDTITGMFFYQFGVDYLESIYAPPRTPIAAIDTAGGFGGFTTTQAIVMFQGENFASTSIYYIPFSWNEGLDTQGCVEPVDTQAYDRKEDGKSGLNKICVDCLALIPVKSFMSDSTWNKVKNGGGWIRVVDRAADGVTVNIGGNTIEMGGLMYKGEVYKLSTKPNIFAPLKTYHNSLSDGL